MTWSSDISDWQKATFGQVTPERALERTHEEWVELVESGDPLEAADVVIVLCALAAACGKDLATLVEQKMAINRARKWNVGPDGTGYHVKEPSGDV